MARDFIDIHDDDFKAMRYNVVALGPGESCSKKWGELAAHEILANPPSIETPNGKVSRDKTLRYIILAYDKNSPYVRRLKDMKTRKESAANKAGLDVSDKSVQHIITGKCDEVNRMISAFFKHLNDRMWELYVSGQEFFSQLNEDVRSPIEETTDPAKVANANKIKRQNFMDAMAMHEDLSNIEQKIFGDNDDIREIMDKETKTIKGSKMEQRAAAKLQGN